LYFISFYSVHAPFSSIVSRAVQIHVVIVIVIVSVIVTKYALNISQPWCKTVRSRQVHEARRKRSLQAFGCWDKMKCWSPFICVLLMLWSQNDDVRYRIIYSVLNQPFVAADDRTFNVKLNAGRSAVARTYTRAMGYAV